MQYGFRPEVRGQSANKKYCNTLVNSIRFLPKFKRTSSRSGPRFESVFKNTIPLGSTSGSENPQETHSGSCPQSSKNRFPPQNPSSPFYLTLKVSLLMKWLII
ncbi:hypothetical protein AVEN_101753-1 [Araneus ventricosus]|uniref:Uncharacterized protein n=1 Tax=Araneus ventricosus TaxID=182803 RepID=A0A4Y2VUM7_ARAVE|nr:hypothetical protein AVEN_101753-1 [Araneus ventricosus]